MVFSNTLGSRVKSFAHPITAGSASQSDMAKLLRRPSQTFVAGCGAVMSTVAADEGGFTATDAVAMIGACGACDGMPAQVASRTEIAIGNTRRIGQFMRERRPWPRVWPRTALCDRPRHRVVFTIRSLPPYRPAGMGWWPARRPAPLAAWVVCADATGPPVAGATAAGDWPAPLRSRNGHSLRCIRAPHRPGLPRAAMPGDPATRASASGYPRTTGHSRG